MEHNDKRKAVNISEARPEPELRKDRFRNYMSSKLVAVEKFGNVVGRIYENQTHAGDVLVYKLEMVRLYSMSGGSGEAFSFEFCDLEDATRCTKWSQKWMWRAERQRHRANRW